MVSGVDFLLVESVLEPSAGKGDLVDAIVKKMRVSKNKDYEYSKYVPDIDTIEINPDLRHVLTGKGYREWSMTTS